MEKRFLIPIIIIAILIIVGLAWYYFLGPGKNYVAYQEAVAGLSGNEAILVVNSGQQERMFAGEIIDGMTIADVLRASSLSVDDGQIAWQCSLNGKDVSEQITTETVHPKDKIVCKY